MFTELLLYVLHDWEINVVKRNLTFFRSRLNISYIFYLHDKLSNFNVASVKIANH